MASTDLLLGSDATASNNLIVRADGAGGGSICNGAGTSLVKVPAGGVPAFRAFLSGADQTTTSGLQGKVNLNGETFDVGGCFNNTASPVTLNGLSVPAYSFMPNVAGYYQLSGSVSYGTSSMTRVFTSLFRNGAELVRGLDTSATFGSTAQMSFTDLVYLDGSTHYVDLRGYVVGTTPVFYAGTAYTYFSGILIKAA